MLAFLPSLSPVMQPTCRRAAGTALLCLALLPVHAQTPLSSPPVAPPVVAPPNPRATDTVRAVHLLFQDWRTGGLTFTLIGLPLTGIFSVLSVGYSPSTGTTTTQSNKTETLLEGAFFGALPLGVGISKLARFSKAKETALILSYQQGHPLPFAIRERLTKKYFL